MTKTSPLLAAEWRAISAGKDEMEITKMLIAARGSRPSSGVAPRKVNRAKLLALYRKEQTQLKK